MTRKKLRFMSLLIILAIVVIISLAFVVNAENSKEIFEISDQSMDVFPITNQTAILIDELFGYTNIDGTARPSGWDIDRRGGDISASYYRNFQLNDNSLKESITMSKEFRTIIGGNATFEAVFTSLDVVDGFSYTIFGDDTVAMQFVTFGNKFCYVDQDKKMQPIATYDIFKTVGFKAEIDMATQKVAVYANGKFINNYSFTNECKKINKLKIQTPANKKMTVNLGEIMLYTNYLVNEKFFTPSVGTVPSDWTADSISANSVSVQEKGGTANYSDQTSLLLKDTSILDRAKVTKAFKDTDGKICFEIKLLMDSKTDGIKLALKSGNVDGISVKTLNGYLSTGKLNAFYQYQKNIWNTLRIEADIKTQTALIRWNGSVRAEKVPFDNAVSNFNSIEISSSFKSRTAFCIDDVLVFQMQPEPSDYVAEPVVAQKTDYLIGMQSCGLWKTGTHVGWDAVNAEAEIRKPYLGFYDEGIPETADWETKWLVEHGVDFQMYCWFSSGYKSGVPIKTPHLLEGLHDGFFNSKYGDKMKFVIMWENGSNGGGVKSSAEFRNEIVPYWVEYYLKNPRYMVVDNKPVISIYTTGGLLTSFGSEANAVAEMNYLRDVCKGLGYDDAIILFQTYGMESFTQTAKKMSADGGFVYTFGMDQGLYGITQQAALQKLLDKRDTILPTAAAISMGFDPSAWGRLDSGRRYIEPQEFTDLAKWIKSDYLPKFSKDSIFSKMIILDNWNEFGEGHYIAPSTLNGFAYLDALRDTFANGDFAPNVVPTVQQRSRINYMYPQDRKVISTVPYLKKAEVPMKVIKGWYFDNPIDVAQWKIGKQVENLQMVDGLLTGTSTGNDPSINLKEDLNIDISAVTKIRVKFQTDPLGESGQIYFSTVAKPQLAEEMSAKMGTTLSSDIMSYDFDMTKVKDWTGICKAFRFDMMREKGYFKIQSIELLGKADDFVDDSYTLTIDGEPFVLALKPIVQEDVLVPITGIVEKLQINQKWDGKTLTLEKNNKILKLTLGQQTATLNGEALQISTPISWNEKKMIIPIMTICNALKINATRNDDKRVIGISQEKESTVVNLGPKIPFQWEFNGVRDFESWTLSGATGIVTSGVVYMKPDNNDSKISITGISFKASDYKIIRVRMKQNTSSTYAELYFANDAEDSYSQEKSIRLPIVSGDEFKEYEFDMSSNPKWTGNITKLRFDPVATADGTVQIDYIRVFSEQETNNE